MSFLGLKEEAAFGYRTDSANKPVAGLCQSDFEVIEDGVKQNIASFSADRQPISLVILIDASGSIAPKLAKIRAAAASIIRQTTDQDEFSLLAFTTNTVVLQDFTADSASADRALNTIKAGGGTALLDGVKTALAYADQNAKHERKAVLLVTDGAENSSQQTTRADVFSLLQRGNVLFYAVGFPEGLGQGPSPDTRGRSPVKSRPDEALAKGLLNDLSNASSGGHAFFPRQDTELGRITDTIVSDLRAPRYTLGYYPLRSQATAAGWRSVQVLTHSAGEQGPMNARTRAGYYAGQPKAGNTYSAGSANAYQPVP